MNLIATARNWFGLPPLPPEARTEFPSFEEQYHAIHYPYIHARGGASVGDALSVPAIFRAVTLISNTVGTLSLEAWRAEELLAPTERPRIIVRPDPKTTPREFYRASAYSLAARGEAWWWIAKRDGDDVPLSLYNVPPQQVVVSQDDADLLRPRIEWKGKVMPNEDMVQIVFAREPGELRGYGPLQKCGAAVNVAVESMAWAANFFAQGGVPSLVIKTLNRMTEDEARDFKAQWSEMPSNVPRIVDPEVDEIKDFGFDPQKAQLVESRSFERGEVAVMFGIPGSLLEHSEPGSSLTYQNVGQEYDKFVRACLWPGYLEPIEQALSDLLTRSTVARFNVEGLLRPDIKTRFEVHEKAVAIGVYDADYARTIEGLAPGSVETAPMPPSLPAAVPTSLPIQGRTAEPEGEEVACRSVVQAHGRMTRCGRKLGRATPPYSLYCPRCKAYTDSEVAVA